MAGYCLHCMRPACIHPACTVEGREAIAETEGMSDEELIDLVRAEYKLWSDSLQGEGPTNVRADRRWRTLQRVARLKKLKVVL